MSIIISLLDDYIYKGNDIESQQKSLIELFLSTRTNHIIWNLNSTWIKVGLNSVR